MSQDPPFTRPGESARIKAIAGDDPYRTEVLISLAILQEQNAEDKQWRRTIDEWRSEHDRVDARSFAEIRTDVATLKSNLGGVSSKVETEKDNNRYSLRQMVVGVLILCGAIGGVISWMFALLHGGKP